LHLSSLYVKMRPNMLASRLHHHHETIAGLLTGQDCFK
jgi:hypothetical protein